MHSIVMLWHCFWCVCVLHTFKHPGKVLLPIDLVEKNITENVTIWTAIVYRQHTPKMKDLATTWKVMDICTQPTVIPHKSFSCSVVSNTVNNNHYL